ncbi:MAG: hypothetical protein GF401_07745 [Chitinivibrionales bacterium]|nr:hypothetical protein [Chitinivibrionales bacterium]
MHRTITKKIASLFLFFLLAIPGFGHDVVVNSIHLYFDTTPVETKLIIDAEVSLYRMGLLPDDISLRRDVIASRMPTILEYLKKSILFTLDGEPVSYITFEFGKTIEEVEAGEMFPVFPVKVKFPIPTDAQRLGIELNTLSSDYELANTPVAIRELKQLPLVGVFLHLPGKERASLRLAKDGSRTFLKLENGMPVIQTDMKSAKDDVSFDSLVTVAAQARFAKFIHLGFFNIIPSGKEHVLFVLALLFIAVNAGMVARQVGLFAGAYIFALFLVTGGGLSISINHAEALVAFSAAAVGIENVFSRKLSHARLVFLPLFGFLHGYYSATLLTPFMLGTDSPLVVAGAYSLGSIGGIAMILCAGAALTVWFWKKEWYYSRITVPVSMGLALFGLFFGLKSLLG